MAASLACLTLLFFVNSVSATVPAPLSYKADGCWVKGAVFVPTKYVAPFIDFALGTEPGTSSPDASAGVPPAKGSYAFYVDGDNQVKVFVTTRLVVNKKTTGCQEISKRIKLAGNQPVEVEIEYVHVTGEPSLHVNWSGPGLDKQILLPMKSQLAVDAGRRLLSP